MGSDPTRLYADALLLNLDNVAAGGDCVPRVKVFMAVRW